MKVQVALLEEDCPDNMDEWMNFNDKLEQGWPISQKPKQVNTLCFERHECTNIAMHINTIKRHFSVRALCELCEAISGHINFVSHYISLP